MLTAFYLYSVSWFDIFLHCIKLLFELFDHLFVKDTIYCKYLRICSLFRFVIAAKIKIKLGSFLIHLYLWTIAGSSPDLHHWLGCHISFHYAYLLDFLRHIKWRLFIIEERNLVIRIILDMNEGFYLFSFLVLSDSCWSNLRCRFIWSVSQWSVELRLFFHRYLNLFHL